MAHGLSSAMKSVTCKSEGGGKSVGSRRIFAPHFKLQVLDSYRNDADCKGNQRATARKYGIHRRQIQKWLQVENTLRHSVIGAKERSPEGERRRSEACEEPVVELTLNGHASSSRQRDDHETAAFEARVPALASCRSPQRPLDFSTPRLSPRDPLSAPIDLSFKRPTSIAPVRYAPPTPPPLSSPPARPHPDVWDLSTKNNNNNNDDYDYCCSTRNDLKRKSSSSSTSPKPVKLFKPYLDDLDKEEVKLEAPSCCPATRTPSCEGFCYDNNNVGNAAKTVWGVVNVETEVKCEYGSSYTLHELQPEPPALNYYYYHPAPYAAPADCPVAAAVCCYDEHAGGGCYGGPPAAAKQRQSYSLDFKLRAIDSYYEDTLCKGNQRAVASKYNVHRRQVQKWLKQAEELRSRNETMKQIHAVG